MTALPDWLGPYVPPIQQSGVWDSERGMLLLADNDDGRWDDYPPKLPGERWSLSTTLMLIGGSVALWWLLIWPAYVALHGHS